MEKKSPKPKGSKEITTKLLRYNNAFPSESAFSGAGLLKHIKPGLMLLLCLALLLPACSKMTKTQKGAVVGTAAGGTMGAIIGKATGNTAMGAIIGATVGGVTGAVIGNSMDKQAKEIEQSVPGVTVERVGEGIVVEFSNKILFEVEQYSLSENAKSSLSSLVTVLNQYPDTDIEIQGHTDSDGSTSFNQNLSEERAIAVSNYLITTGVNPGRITIIGFGEKMPKYENQTEDGKANNRRVEFLITANEKMTSDAEKEAAHNYTDHLMQH